MCGDAKVLYLFCFARPGMTAALTETGVDGHSPVLIRSSPIATAVVSELSLAEFCGPATDAQMQDLAWVGPRACRHEKVIEAVMQHSPVLPARFGTLFSSPANLQQFLETHGQAISQFLDRVADQEEWAVKGFLDKARARQSALARELAAQAGRLGTLPAGKRYLEEQRIRREADQKRHAELNEICQALAADLRGYASAFSERKVLADCQAGNGVEAIVNWAFLLPKSGVRNFQAEIELANENHGDTGLTFKLSGPWPPYSFAPSLASEAAQ